MSVQAAFLAYDEYLRTNGNRFGHSVLLRSGFLAGYAAAPRFEWDDVIPAVREQHRLDCPAMCSWCQNRRATGMCVVCGVESEADESGSCFHCGHILRMDRDPAEDRAWSQVAEIWNAEDVK